jgi:hypothetical protein
LTTIEEYRKALDILDEAIREFALVSQGEDSLLTDWVIGLSGQAYDQEGDPVSRYTFNYRPNMSPHAVNGLTSMMYDSFSDTGGAIIATIMDGPGEGDDDDYDF